MSTHVVPRNGNVVSGPAGFLELVTAAIRAPVSYAIVGNDVVYTFTPDLSAGEATTFAQLLTLSRSRVPGITAAEWAALEPDRAVISAFRALTRNQFVNLPEADMRRTVFDMLTALANHDRALFRDAG